MSDGYTISETLKELLAPLKEWARANNGKIVVVADKLRAFTSILAQSPGSFVGYLCFNGEVPRSESASNYREGKVDRSFLLIASHGRSMKLDADSDLIGDGTADKSTLDKIEEGREVLRKTEFDTDNAEEAFPEYKGTTPFHVDGFLLDAWQIEISIPADLPTYTPTAQS